MIKTVTLSIFSLTIIGLTSLVAQHKKGFDKFLRKSAYIFVPSGKTFVDGKEVTVNAFYMSKGEITNFQYAEFLNYLKRNNDTVKLKICQIDTLNWNTSNSMNSKMVEFYHDHPAYHNYPVVNVSHEAAKLYCSFVSKALNDNFPEVTVEARLPMHVEYVRAARGDDANLRYGWNSNETRNKDGQILGNFTRIGDECITKNQETGKYEVNRNGIPPVANSSNDLLAPSLSYWPNQFGFYNLSGNAAEMIDFPGIAYGGSWSATGYDARIDAKKEYTGSDKAVGFRIVFTYLKKEK